jgi:hypothetical protein
VASLKQFASSTLPALEQRLSLAAETGNSVGADVTSKSAQGRGPSGK